MYLLAKWVLVAVCRQIIIQESKQRPLWLYCLIDVVIPFCCRPSKGRMGQRSSS